MVLENEWVHDCTQAAIGLLRTFDSNMSDRDDQTTGKRRAEEEHSGAPSSQRPRRFQEIDRLNDEWRNEIAILQTRLESIGNYHNISALESDSIKSGLNALLNMCKAVAIGRELSIDALSVFKQSSLDDISVDQWVIPDSVPACTSSHATCPARLRASAQSERRSTKRSWRA